MRANRSQRVIRNLLKTALLIINRLILQSPQNIINYISNESHIKIFHSIIEEIHQYIEETGSLQSNNVDNLRMVSKVKKSQPDTYVPTDDVVKEA
jgi:intergrase/recombinase